MKRSFQKGNRVWSVECVGKRLTTTSGVAGCKPQSKTNGYGSAGATKDRLRADARLELQAGYVETTFRGELPLDDPTARGLLEALAENPDDLASHMAFADWLGEQADDRLIAWGEFMRLQLAQERAPPIPKRESPDQQRMEDLRDDYEMHWLGEELAKPALGMGIASGPSYHWIRPQRYARGWLDSLAVFGLDKVMAGALAKPTILRLLANLDIINSTPYLKDGSLALLARSSVMANVRHLYLQANGSDAGLNALIAGMPRLKSLRLAVVGLDPRRLFSMPSLTSLDTLEVVGPMRYHVQNLAANPVLANIRRLALNTTTKLEAGDFDDWPGQLGDEEIHTICYSPRLKGLRELALHGVEIGHVGSHALGDSDLLARLELLDLTRGNLDDDCARIIASSPDFARVPRVILDGNYLSPSMVRRLRQINKGVRAKDQREPHEFDLDLGDYE